MPSSVTFRAAITSGVPSRGGSAEITTSSASIVAAICSRSRVSCSTGMPAAALFVPAIITSTSTSSMGLACCAIKVLEAPSRAQPPTNSNWVGVNWATQAVPFATPFSREPWRPVEFESPTTAILIGIDAADGLGDGSPPVGEHPARTITLAEATAIRTAGRRVIGAFHGSVGTPRLVRPHVGHMSARTPSRPLRRLGRQGFHRPRPEIAAIGGRLTYMPSSFEEPSPATSAVERPKIAFLEAVRGLAAMIVVVQHIAAAQFPAFEDFSRTFLDLGRVGVVAFFVVSGYVITLSLEHQSPRTFLIRRFFRLFPLYWLVLIGFLVAGALVPSTSTVPLTAAVLGTNILMVQGITPIATIIPVAWTLGIELIFYAQAFVASVVRRVVESVWLGFVWLGLYAAAQVGGAIMDRDVPSTPFMLLFTASLGHALYLRDQYGSRHWAGLLAAGVVAIPLFAALRDGVDPEWPALVYSLSFWGGLLLFGAFYLFARRRVSPTLVWLGGISYGLYLLHPLVYRLINTANLDPVLCIVASGVATIVVAWVLHRFVELPFVALGRRLSTSRRLDVAPYSSA
jgi:peptidoglycan/LPS O-acetylase OafA/YrhL